MTLHEKFGYRKALMICDWERSKDRNSMGDDVYEKLLRMKWYFDDNDRISIRDRRVRCLNFDENALRNKMG